MGLSRPWTEFEEPSSASPEASTSGLTHIPLPQHPLTDNSQKEYWMWCQRLLEIGRLDEIMQTRVEMYAYAKDDLGRKIAKGQSVRAPQEQISSFLKRMREIHGEHQSTPQSFGQEDPYARFGFAKRARQRFQDHR